MDIIIGTAGHIDHGKTALIRALTGIETDRLKEEQERGITIVLGFAYFNLPNGDRVGIVDVPGHEKFLRNMLAGVTGIDLVLLVVAADDGIMPQTQEHLDILNLLRVKHGIVVITKIDSADPSRVQTVKENIQKLIEPTSLSGSPILSVSSVTGEGIDKLKEQIVESLKNVIAKPVEKFFRLPIDRVFTMTGFGTIITGTLISGQVNLNDRVRILPQNREVKIRGIQVHNQSQTNARAGHRTALNLTGIEKEEIHPGDMICELGLQRTTTRFDTFIQILPSIQRPIENLSTVRLHIGTCEMQVKLILFGRDKLNPSDNVYCQIVTETPIHALRTDRFIIRDLPTPRILGGGEILNPFAPKYKRNEPGLIENLKKLHQGTIPEILQYFVNVTGEQGITENQLLECLNLPKQSLAESLKSPAIYSYPNESEVLIFSKRVVQEIQQSILSTLKSFHFTHPIAKGMELEQLKITTAKETSLKVFREWITELAKKNRIILEGNLLRLSEHRVQYAEKEQSIRNQLQSIYTTRSMDPPKIGDLPKLIQSDEKEILKVLNAMVQNMELIKLSSEIFILKEELVKIKTKITEFGKTHPEFRASDIRDLLQSSRKLIIPLLEYFDKIGLTLRKGDLRSFRK